MLLLQLRLKVRIETHPRPLLIEGRFEVPSKKRGFRGVCTVFQKTKLLLFFEFFVKVFQGLGDDLYIRNHGHKVRVAVPSGHDVEVEMADKSRAGRLSQVDAEIETFRLHYFREEFLHVPCQFHDFQHFLTRQVGDVRLVRVGCNHEMSAVVRIFVHDAKTRLPSVDYEVFFVLIVPDCVTEKAAVFFWMFLNIGNAPGRPEIFHCLITLKKCSANPLWSAFC